MNVLYEKFYTKNELYLEVDKNDKKIIKVKSSDNLQFILTENTEIYVTDIEPRCCVGQDLYCSIDKPVRITRVKCNNLFTRKCEPKPHFLKIDSE